MCRYFPAGSNILKTTFDYSQGIYVAVAEKDGKYTMAAVNANDTDKSISVSFPEKIKNASLYRYDDEHENKVPVKTEINVNKTFKVTIKGQSLVLLTNME
jgi:hypothetical protein